MGISFVFIIRVFIGMKIDFSYFPGVGRSLFYICLFSIITVLQYLLQGIAWNTLLSFIANVKVNIKKTMNVYLRANIAKYIPGNVMHFAGRNLLGKELNIKQSDIALATLVEIVSMGLSAVILVLFFASEDLFRVAEMIWQTPMYRMIFISILLLLIITLAIILIIVLKKRLDLNKYRCFLSVKFLKRFIICMLIYMVNFIVFGLIFVWIFQFILGQAVPWNYYMPIVSLTILSWIAGHLIPGVPGGIGVRESITILLMNNMFGIELAAVAAVVSRLISVFADIFSFLYACLIMKKVSGAKS